MRNRIKKSIVLILALLGLGIGVQYKEELVGFTTNRGFSTLPAGDISTIKITVASVSFENLATASYELIPAPGTNQAIELVAVTGYRNFSSESWKSNNAVGLGMGIGFSDEREIIASFSLGFATGGSGYTPGSPSYETKYPVDYIASASKALVLTRINQTANVIPTIDGDTSFMFEILYKIINLP